MCRDIALHGNNRARQTKENKPVWWGWRQRKTNEKKHRETIKGKQTKGNKHRKGKKQRPPALSQRRRTWWGGRQRPQGEDTSPARCPGLWHCSLACKVYFSFGLWDVFCTPYICAFGFLHTLLGISSFLLGGQARHPADQNHHKRLLQQMHLVIFSFVASLRACAQCAHVSQNGNGIQHEVFISASLQLARHHLTN